MGSDTVFKVTQKENLVKKKIGGRFLTFFFGKNESA
jgi:hypothetical protein